MSGAVLKALGSGTSSARISGCGLSWDAAQIVQQVQEWSALFGQVRAQRVASLLDNHPHGLALDLGLRQCGAIHIPLPPFFTPAQLQHALKQASVDTLICAVPNAWIAQGWELRCAGGPGWSVLQRKALQPVVAVPTNTALITFTSGSTGAPKGVCLSGDLLDAVAHSVAEAMSDTGARRHRCVLPLSVLLEQVAGASAALLLGAEVILEPLHSAGLQGASGVDGWQLAAALHACAAHSVILLPQMLRALVDIKACTDGVHLPELRLIAVGGARVGSALLEQCAQLGLPVFEGYGLSECGSVVALNRPTAYRPGSVGQPLSHLRLRIAADGEILVDGAVFLGYLGDTSGADMSASNTLATGDLGQLDADGFLHITGRKKHLLITAFGRNVSPEWVEGELLAQPGIAQAFVWGDALPALQAVLVPSAADVDLAQAVRAANAGLPDYARIGDFQIAAAFSAANGLLTSNGKLQRAALLARYGQTSADQPEPVSVSVSVSVSTLPEDSCA